MKLRQGWGTHFCGWFKDRPPASCLPDAPKIDISEDQLSKRWGKGDRRWIFAEDVNQSEVEQLVAGPLYQVQSLADKIP